jgi:hypothetical protein
VVLGAVVAALLVAGPARAQQLGGMPIYALSPASGSTLSLQPSSSSTRVVFQSAPYTDFDMITGITFEVSSSPLLGADGTLSDDFNVDYNYIHNGDTDPSVYVTALRNWNFLQSQPGIYYLQFSAYTYATHQHVASPVFWFRWDPTATAAPTAAPAPAPAPTPAAPDTSMTRSDAIANLRSMVHRKLGRWPTAVAARCARTSASSFSCRPTFRVGRRGYAGRFAVRRYVGDDGTSVFWTATFSGRRGDGVAVHWRL